MNDDELKKRFELTDFFKLDKTERSAFLAWFAGGKTNVTLFSEKTGEHVSFGKHECD